MAKTLSSDICTADITFASTVSSEPSTHLRARGIFSSSQVVFGRLSSLCDVCSNTALLGNSPSLTIFMTLVGGTNCDGNTKVQNKTEIVPTMGMTVVNLTGSRLT